MEPFEDDNIVPLTDIAPMTINDKKEIVLIFGLNWDGYDQYRLEIENNETNELAFFVVDSSQFNRCTYNEYLNRRYTELMSPILKSDQLQLNDYDVTLILRPQGVSEIAKGELLIKMGK